MVQQLRKELEQQMAELGAQQLALASLGGERDACRSAFQDATQHAEASLPKPEAMCSTPTFAFGLSFCSSCHR